MIPNSRNLVSYEVPRFTRRRSFPEFSIAAREDWVTEGLETIKGHSCMRDSLPLQKKHLSLLNSDILDRVSRSSISSGATF